MSLDWKSIVAISGLIESSSVLNIWKTARNLCQPFFWPLLVLEAAHSFYGKTTVNTFLKRGHGPMPIFVKYAC